MKKYVELQFFLQNYRYDLLPKSADPELGSEYRSLIFLAGMRIRSDPLIFDPSDPDPTCNNEFIN